MCGEEPTPPEPKVIGSLLFLARAMNSLKFFTGNDGCTTISSGVYPVSVIGVKSRMVSYGALP